MASKNKNNFIDAQTDMTGFQINLNDKFCQVEYI